MSDDRTVRRALNGPRPTVDWSRFDAMTDADIQAGVDADPDAAPIIDEQWLAKAYWRSQGLSSKQTTRKAND